MCVCVRGRGFVCVCVFRAAELMTRTGSVVTLEVAKQGAIYHGLATLLNQPSPMMQRGTVIHAFLTSVVVLIVYIAKQGEINPKQG